ncbi:TetR/AcrR family transcriptional regulator [Cupriavidus alkaliphilus]|uniref:TetR/AcrR family transcriptional regulator n=1 Tax=Cupriavidus alkaliphilus TaxID=942866 RepID=UPI00160CC957|nr:TetR/AcrR family transcriptional regulator [Cupriavidus alkaliphilus]MBB3013367.1 AcrR family transcriptional regulator [Cupriavidus alkaliphilus]
MTDVTTRDRIVAEADKLFYERGFEHTSFADIADAVGISRGNFYHHFKSKDAILDAVIGARAARTRQMLETWDAASSSPLGRIRSFIRIVVTNQASIMRHGCPVGTLCTELAKVGHPAQPQASQLFTLFRTWLRRQFTLLGRKADADALAMHVLAFSQGVAVLAHAFHDKRFVQQEVERICAWLDGIAADAARVSGD